MKRKEAFYVLIEELGYTINAHTENTGFHKVRDNKFCRELTLYQTTWEITKGDFNITLTDSELESIKQATMDYLSYKLHSIE